MARFPARSGLVVRVRSPLAGAGTGAARCSSCWGPGASVHHTRLLPSTRTRTPMGPARARSPGTALHRTYDTGGTHTDHGSSRHTGGRLCRARTGVEQAPLVDAGAIPWTWGPSARWAWTWGPCSSSSLRIARADVVGGGENKEVYYYYSICAGRHLPDSPSKA